MSSNVQERLRKLLLLVPFVARHQGIGVEALAGELGMEREQLLAEIDLLAMVGRPPFQPDDFIDLHVENDRVYVDLDQRFHSPPRLTAPEAAALAAAAELLRPASGEALSSAIGKLEKVLPPGVRERYREIHGKIDASLDAPRELEPLGKAIARRLEVHFDYFNPGRGQTERRVVHPHELFSHRGQWYLAAFDVKRNDARLFRLDRISGTGLKITDTPFTPHPSIQQVPRASIPNPAVRGDVTVRFSRTAAPYVRERFSELARPIPEGGVEVSVSGESERWLTQWVLSFGGEAWVHAPEWAREAVARAATASLES